MSKKKEYITPELTYVRLTLCDVLKNSVEGFSDYVDPDPGDWGDDPLFDLP